MPNTAAAAGSDNSIHGIGRDVSQLIKGQEASLGKRNAGRQRQEGTAVRVVRSAKNSAVRPLLVSQSSLPAVDHAAPTKPTQPPVKSAKAITAAEDDAAAAAAEHTAMLDKFRAEWRITEQDNIAQKLYKHMEWRMFWLGHTSGISVLDFEERIVFGILYLAVILLLVFEGYRRLCGSLQGLY